MEKKKYDLMDKLDSTLRTRPVFQETYQDRLDALNRWVGELEETTNTFPEITNAYRTLITRWSEENKETAKII